MLISGQRVYGLRDLLYFLNSGELFLDLQEYLEVVGKKWGTQHKTKDPK